MRAGGEKKCSSRAIRGGKGYGAGVVVESVIMRDGVWA